MSEIASQSCEICGEKNWKKLLERQMTSVCSGREIIKDAQLFKEMCNNCGFVITAKTPLDSDLNNYYNKVYSSKLRSETYDYINYSHGLSFTDVQRKFILSHDFPEKGKMMDIGCGKGLLGKTFYEKYPKWKIEGVDPSQKSIEFATKNLPEGKFYNRLFDGVDYKQNAYDLICMHAVLNRVPPRKFLKEATSMLKPGGILSAEVVIFPMAPFELYFADHSYMYFKEHFLALTEEFKLQLIKEDKKGSKWRFLLKKCKRLNRFRREKLFSMAEKIKESVEKIVQSWQFLFEEMTKCIKMNKEIAFYGQGTTLMILLSNVDFPVKQINGIYDDNPYKIGEHVFGIKVEKANQKMKTADAIVLCGGPEGITPMIKNLTGYQGQIFHL